MNRIVLLVLTLILLLPGVAWSGPKSASVPYKYKDNGSLKYVKCKKNAKGRWRKKAKRKNDGRSSIEPRASQANACKSLLPGKVSLSLSKLPLIGGIVASKLSGLISSRSWSRDVEGTPPLIAELPDTDPKDLYWLEGVVQRIADGEPTAQDCDEFFSGSQDGESGGFAACNLAESTGRGLEEALSGATSLCYMKNIPSFEGKGVSVLSGTENLPDGDVTKAFDTPKGESSRLVEIRLENREGEDEDHHRENIFIRVNSKQENKQAGIRYGYTISFCRPDENQLLSQEITTIGKEGKFTKLESRSDAGEDSNVSVSGYLTLETDGGLSSIEFNPDLPRSISVAFRQEQQGDPEQEEGEQGFTEKVEVTFTPNNQIRTKSYSVDDGRRSFSVTNFLGTGLSEARFTSGVYKDENDNSPDESFEAYVEYRTSRYVTAPDMEERELLEQIDLQSDAFYVEPEFSFNEESFDCSSTGDVVLSMDFGDEGLAPLEGICEGERLGSMAFCFEDPTIQQALAMYDQVCLQQP